MKSIEFVEGIRESVIDSNIQIYNKIFQNTLLNQVKDPYWVKALSLFNSIDVEQREILFLIIRQVQVDTVSNILGVLDGSSTLFNNQKEEFVLTTNSDMIKINGDLQDIFLELEST